MIRSQAAPFDFSPRARAWLIGLTILNIAFSCIIWAMRIVLIVWLGADLWEDTGITESVVKSITGVLEAVEFFIILGECYTLYQLWTRKIRIDSFLAIKCVYSAYWIVNLCVCWMGGITNLFYPGAPIIIDLGMLIYLAVIRKKTKKDSANFCLRELAKDAEAERAGRSADSSMDV